MTPIPLPRCRFIVPMKPLAESKTRLRKHLPPDLCDALVLLMLERVLAAISELRVCPCVVVGGDEPVRRVAAALEADWTPESGTGLNDAVRLSMQAAYADGMEVAVYLPGDLPLITPKDVMDIVWGGRMLKRPVGVPAATGGGTNALLIPAGMDMEPLLGEDSYLRHREAAKRAGTTIRTMKLSNVMLDLDTEDEYQWLKWNIENFAALLLDWREWLHSGMQTPLPPSPLEEREARNKSRKELQEWLDRR